MSDNAVASYAGDVSARAAWDDLARTADATLVDVRTKAEWVYVGQPVLDPLGKSLVGVSWDSFPGGEVLPDFTGRLKTALDGRGVSADAPLYFICRSGGRSRRAAKEATAAGYRRCYNVEFGFEGNLDDHKHRATAGSWKAEGLPWAQS